MVTAIADPIVTIRDLLKARWDGGNTSNVTPRFTTGWYDEDLAVPQVSVTGPFQIATAHGMKGDGSGLVDSIEGTVFVNGWATRDSTSIEPQQLVWEFVEEAIRIIKTVEVTPPDNGLDVLRAGNDFRLTDPTLTPTVYRREVEVGYSWIRE